MTGLSICWHCRSLARRHNHLCLKGWAPLIAEPCMALTRSPLPLLVRACIICLDAYVVRVPTTAVYFCLTPCQEDSYANQNNMYYLVDGLSEISQEPFQNSSSTLPDSLNWDDWTTSRHINGVTVYQQQEPDSKEATYMVSASVHATPEDCLKVGSSPCCPGMHHFNSTAALYLYSVPLYSVPSVPCFA